jgi:hypothetical protein
MKSSNPEVRSPKQIQIPKFKMRGRMARSVLECGSPLPISPGLTLAHSKTWRRLLAFILLLNAPLLAVAQSYSIDWFTIDGGGGTSTGGVYSVSGTIGQPDAGGPMTAGNFSVTGGFWSLLSVVQTPGAPVLTITLTPTNTAIVSWPSPSTGFLLQQNTNLNTPDWFTPIEQVVDNGTNKFITISPPGGSRFYRLFKP